MIFLKSHFSKLLVASVFFGGSIAPLVPASNGLISVSVFKDNQTGALIYEKQTDKLYAEQGMRGGASQNPTKEGMAWQMSYQLPYTSQLKTSATSSKEIKSSPFFEDDLDTFVTPLEAIAQIAEAAIAADATSSGNAAATSVTVAHTITGANTILITGIGDQSGVAGNTTGCTYNAVAMTKIDEQQTNTDPTYSSLWGLLAPSDGTNNIVCSRTNNADNFTAVSASYTGVSQATAIGSLPKGENAGSGTSGSVTLTTTADNSQMVMVAYNRLQGESAGTDTTQIVNSGNHENLYASTALISPAGAFTLNFNQNDTHWGAVAVAFGPVVVSVGGDTTIFEIIE